MRSGVVLAGFAALLAVGAVVAGCTSQNGTGEGPTHPAAQTGGVDAGVNLFAVSQFGPGGNQFTIIALVQSPGGRPVQGVTVNVATTSGRLRPNRGVTDGNGEFRSILTCDLSSGVNPDVLVTAEGASTTLTAIPCLGAPAPATGTTGGTPTPAPSS